MIPEPDPLTEVLDVFPLRMRFAGRLELTAPWGLSLPERWAGVCAVKHSQWCWLTANGTEQTMSLATGDVVVLSPGCRHELLDALASRVVPIESLLHDARAESGPLLAFGGSGARTTLLGGVFECDDAGTHPLCSALPPVIRLRQQDPEHSRQLKEVVGLIDSESSASRPGGRAVIGRLVEILLIQAMRARLAETGEAPEGSLRGMLHPDLGRALALIHRQPEKSWTVAGLAERSAMSRSAFSATFARVLGKPPLQYLRERRMRLACRLLRDPSLGLKEVASRVGYDSVSAFSTAFRRLLGTSPGDYRRRGRTPPEPD